MDEHTDEHDPAGDEPVDRRRFLNGTWKALGVVLIAEGAWTSYDILRPDTSQGAGSVIDAGPVSDYAEEGVTMSLVEVCKKQNSQHMHMCL